MRNKKQEREQRWQKVIRLKQTQYDYIKKKKKELNYKTLAGTLDYIINYYKKNEE